MAASSSSDRPRRGRRALRAGIAIAAVGAAAFAVGRASCARVVDLPSPNFGERRPAGAKVKFVVLHYTQTETLAQALDILRDPAREVSSHYVVDRDGDVYRLVAEDKRAWHAGVGSWRGEDDVNSVSIGIEIVGRHDKEISAAQYASLKKLLGELKRTYTIPDSRVLTHSMVAYGNPNRWHKFKHRGRKRCGMLLATPSARAKLGLAAGPSFDPDVKAGRLRNADPDLAAVLYRKAPAVIAQAGGASGAPKAGTPAAKPGSAAKSPAAAPVPPARP